MITIFELALIVSGRRMSGKRVAEEVQFALQNDGWSVPVAGFVGNDGTRRRVAISVITPDDQDIGELERSLRDYLTPDRGEWLVNDDRSVLEFYDLKVVP